MSGKQTVAASTTPTPGCRQWPKCARRASVRLRSNAVVPTSGFFGRRTAGYGRLLNQPAGSQQHHPGRMGARGIGRMPRSQDQARAGRPREGALSRPALPALTLCPRQRGRSRPTGPAARLRARCGGSCRTLHLAATGCIVARSTDRRGVPKSGWRSGYAGRHGCGPALQRRAVRPG